MKRLFSASNVQIECPRAKAIFSRGLKSPNDIEKERKAREVVAKRAREEAAERDRRAGRAWAEKRARKMA
jgi:hypothetical protein